MKFKKIAALFSACLLIAGAGGCGTSPYRTENDYELTVGVPVVDQGDVKVGGITLTAEVANAAAELKMEYRLENTGPYQLETNVRLPVSLARSRDGRSGALLDQDFSAPDSVLVNEQSVPYERAVFYTETTALGTSEDSYRNFFARAEEADSLPFNEATEGVFRSYVGAEYATLTVRTEGNYALLLSAPPHLTDYTTAGQLTFTFLNEKQIDVLSLNPNDVIQTDLHLLSESKTTLGRCLSPSGELSETKQEWMIGLINDAIRARGYSVIEGEGELPGLTRNAVYTFRVSIPAHTAVTAALRILCMNNDSSDISTMDFQLIGNADIGMLNDVYVKCGVDVSEYRVTSDTVQLTRERNGYTGFADETRLTADFRICMDQTIGCQVARKRQSAKLLTFLCLLIAIPCIGVPVTVSLINREKKK